MKKYIVNYKTTSGCTGTFYSDAWTAADAVTQTLVKYEAAFGSGNVTITSVDPFTPI